MTLKEAKLEFCAGMAHILVELEETKEFILWLGSKNLAWADGMRWSNTTHYEYWLEEAEFIGCTEE